MKKILVATAALATLASPAFAGGEGPKKPYGQAERVQCLLSVCVQNDKTGEKACLKEGVHFRAEKPGPDQLGTHIDVHDGVFTHPVWARQAEKIDFCLASLKKEAIKD